MLLSVKIRDFALINELTLDFGRGLNVLTGETGAGKSIIIDAIALLLGERATAEAIRTGAEAAYVEGIFEVGDKGPARKALEEAGIDAEDGQVIVSREVTPSRSVARINGRAAPLRALGELGATLVDIHGQSEQLSLLRPSRQLEFLDDFAGLAPLRAQVGRLTGERRSLIKEIESLHTDSRELARELDLLRFQVDEIESAGLDPKEEVELARQHRRLAHSRRLQELARAVEAALAASESGRTAANLIATSIDRAREMTGLDPATGSMLEQLQAAADLVDELSNGMRGYAESVEADPERLQQVESRLEALANLKHKYGDTIAAVMEFGRRAAGRLAAIEHSEERLAEVRANLATVEAELAERCTQLSAGRRAGRERLGEAVRAGLRDLGMARARFSTELSMQTDEAGISLPGVEGKVRVDGSGVDAAAFLVSPNPGEEMKPVAAIASGGETSRIMLALKAALSEVDRTPTLIFDEVDQGIGGRSASVVGQKLGALARAHQVLCVTHLPQIAAYADVHFYIEKTPTAGRALTKVRRLEGEEILTELAQMTGTGPGARRAAAEMLQTAMTWKAQERGLKKVER